MAAGPARGTPLRLGIVGCGRVVERLHLPALLLSEQWVVEAVAEPRRERRAWMASRLPTARAFATMDEMLSAEALDAVLVATPPATHRALAIDALSHGIAVLVEKPMAVTVEDARAMCGASHEADRPLWVGFNRRFRKSYRDMRDLLRGQGTVDGCEIEFVIWAGAASWGAVSTFEDADAEGAGVLDDVASHQLDLLPWLLNDRRQRVHARRLDGGTVEITIAFERGSTATCLARHASSHRERLLARHGDRRFLADPAGAWNASSVSPRMARWIADKRGVAHSIWRKATRRPNGSVESMMRQWEAFAGTLSGADVVHDGADAEAGLRCVEAVAACRASLRSSMR
jgi:predicted dehydrogenase